MRDRIKSFVKIVSQTLPVTGPVYEFGSYQVPTQIGYADLRPYFKGIEYVGCDFREGPGVDKIADLHNTGIPDATAGCVLLMDTVEHVEYFWTAVAEIRRILKPGGIFAMSSVMNFLIHDHPSDYWRFTPEGFRSMLKAFESVYVTHAGRDEFPHTVVGVGMKPPSAKPLPPEFVSAMEKWRKEKFDGEDTLAKSQSEIERDYLRYRRLKKNWFFSGFIRLGDRILNK